MYNIKVMKAALLVPLHGNNLSQTTTVVLFGVLFYYFFLMAEVSLFNKIRII